jgi:hypothetical protein
MDPWSPSFPRETRARPKPRDPTEVDVRRAREASASEGPVTAPSTREAPELRVLSSKIEHFPPPSCRLDATVRFRSSNDNQTEPKCDESQGLRPNEEGNYGAGPQAAP